MEFHTLVRFDFKDCCVIIYNFIQILKEVSNIAEPDQTLYFAASGLLLHYLLMLLKNDINLNGLIINCRLFPNLWLLKFT